MCRWDATHRAADSLLRPSAGLALCGAAVVTNRRQGDWSGSRRSTSAPPGSPASGSRSRSHSCCRPELARVALRGSSRPRPLRAGSRCRPRRGHGLEGGAGQRRILHPRHTQTDTARQAHSAGPGNRPPPRRRNVPADPGSGVGHGAGRAGRIRRRCGEHRHRDERRRSGPGENEV